MYPLALKQILYICTFVLLLWAFKPSIFFKPNGKPRQYGVGYDEESYKKTMFTVHVAIIVFVLLLLKFQ